MKITWKSWKDIVHRCTTCSGKLRRIVYFAIYIVVILIVQFSWMNMSSNQRLKEPIIIATNDFRNVRELLNPPVELTSEELDTIHNMINDMKSKGYFTEPTDNIFTNVDPKWPFELRKGLRLIRENTTAKSKHLGEQFAMGAYQYVLYDPNEIDIDLLLKTMSTKSIVKIEEVEKGTQLKLKLHLRKYGPTMFKPKRYDRSYQTSPNQFYFSDYERHFAEIASFHLDRLLGWYRAPPVVGRWVNVTGDIVRLAPEKFRATIFKSPAKNWCFYGHCKYYCDTTNAFCGNPDMIEGSMATFLPPAGLATLYKKTSPWRRSYNKHKFATWRKNDSYCHGVRKDDPLFSSTPRRIPDIVDTHIFDFLTGNLDRHHYLYYDGFPNNDTFHVHFDHGRGFGRINKDERSILGPLYQCCTIRYSTMYKLFVFFTGDHSLGQVLRRSLLRDPVSPVLAEGHYAAVDRRIGKVLLTVEKCLRHNAIDSVVIRDGF